MKRNNNMKPYCLHRQEGPKREVNRRCLLVLCIFIGIFPILSMRADGITAMEATASEEVPEAIEIVAGETTDSLARYLEVAGRNNPGLNASFMEYKASLERVNRSGAWPDPELEIGFFLKPMEIVGGRQVADFTLMQMFPWFGTKKAAQTEATHMARMAYEKFREARDDLFLEMYAQWYRMGRLQQQLTNNKENKKILAQLEQLATQRVSVGSRGGSGGMSDVLRIQLEAAQIDNNIESLQSEMIAEKAKFNALLNRPGDSEVVLPPSLEKVAFPFNASEIARAIEEQNPALGMLQEEERAHEAKEEMEKKMGLPMIGIGLQYMMVEKSPTPVLEHHNGMHMVMPMVSVSLPIFRGKYRSAQRESRILQQSAREKYHNTLNGLQAELYGLQHQLEDAERKVALYGKQREIALTAYRLLVQEFVTGQSDVIDVIEVQRQLLDYQLQEAEAIADYNTRVASVQKLHSFNNTNE